jgi:hypothetical protein
MNKATATERRGFYRIQLSPCSGASAVARGFFSLCSPTDTVEVVRLIVPLATTIVVFQRRTLHGSHAGEVAVLPDPRAERSFQY